MHTENILSEVKNVEQGFTAVEGILRILRFARREGVRRVVLTSNFGAVGFTQTDKSRQTLTGRAGITFTWYRRQRFKLYT